MEPILREKRIYVIDNNSNKRNIRTIEIYNELGQKTVIIDFLCEIYTTRIEYNKNGDIELEIRDKCSSFPTIDNKIKYTYEYDENGNIIKREESNLKIKNFESTLYYKYDENNRLIEIHEKFPNSTRICTTHYTYRIIHNDLIVIENMFYSPGEIHEVIKKKYKDKIGGILIEERKKTFTHQIYENDSKTIYKYDDNNRLIQKDEYDDINKLYSTNYEYYKDTDILLKETSSNGIIAEYFYDNLDI